LILPFQGRHPRWDESVFVEPSAHVVGDVEIGADSSVWFGSLVRGDVNFIRIGARTNVQDLSVIHVTHDTHPTILEDEITVGHRAILHGCRVKNRSLIGMGAIVMDGAQVGPESVVAAGSVVGPGTCIPTRTLARGVPARVVRELTAEEIEEIRRSADRYVDLKNIYRKEPRQSD
jgi:carbonic anhydrase/acetyltransferase-like protein (isoleucine patch superfamily)